MAAAKSKRRSSTSRSSMSRSSSGRSAGSRSSGSRSTSTRVSRTGKTTTDHRTIQRWAEERGGSPACVRGTGGSKDVGMLRIDFPGYSGQRSLQHIDWCDWFDKFDERNLEFLYQDKTASGRRSNFNKLIDRGSEKSRKSHGRSAR